jgi:hypothetical protein
MSSAMLAGHRTTLNHGPSYAQDDSWNALYFDSYRTEQFSSDCFKLQVRQPILLVVGAAELGQVDEPRLPQLSQGGLTMNFVDGSLDDVPDFLMHFIDGPTGVDQAPLALSLRFA